jgi:hypothetical protein
MERERGGTCARDSAYTFRFTDGVVVGLSMPDQPTYAQLWRPLYVVVVVVINGAVYTE